MKIIKRTFTFLTITLLVFGAVPKIPLDLATRSFALAGEINWDELNLVSVEEEIKMGKELSKEVEGEHPILKDSTVQRYVQELGDTMARHVKNPDGIPITVTALKDDEVNAFTIPGGYIYINSGLIKRSDNEAELAAVIAHEISHSVKRHGTQQLTKMYGINFVFGLLLGSDAPQWQYIVANLFSGAGLLAYGREAETQADKMTVAIVNKAGYNPWAYLDFLYKIKEIESSEPNLLTDFFSTHPNIDNRISTVKKELNALAPTKKYPITNTARFDSIRRRIR